ncbi:MAG: class I SAM-dependent methyltransferase [bacterium]
MQKDIWENEYRKQKLVSMSEEPQASVKDFLRWLRKGEEKSKPPRQPVSLENINVLDLGCGTGKNARHIAGLDAGNKITGIEISETALRYARERDLLNPEPSKQITYVHQSIGEQFPFIDTAFDLAFDVTSSNSLDEKERAVFLSETHRVLKPGAYLFVRALCKDADKNAQYLLKHNPGPEKDTYIMPDLGLTERVFSRDDFIQTYSGATIGKPLFTLLHLEKETHYSKVADRLYKRNFWVAYLQK